MHLRVNPSVFSLLSLLTGIAISSCDEPFPTYREPQDVLRGRLTVSSPDTVLMYVFVDTVNQRNHYFVNTPLIAQIKIGNAHDDLLQGEARIVGQVVVQSFGPIPRTIVVPLGPGNLLAPPIVGNALALPPADSAELSAIVLPFDRQGTVIFEGLPFLEWPDSTRVYGPIAMQSYAEVQLFERVQAIRPRGDSFLSIFKVVPLQ